MILGIIPARGGSKGILGKNKKLCAGKPLIQWTIDSAKQSKLLDKIVVTSDDNDILKIAKQNYIDIIKRPTKLATDDSLVIHTLKHTLEEYPDTEIVVLLQPTSPIRGKGLIDKCIKYYQENNYNCVVTGFDCHYKPYEEYTGRRQDLDTFFHNDGNVYILKPDRIKKGKLNSKNYGKVYTSREEQVDVDEEFDFWLAEKILEEKLK